MANMTHGTIQAAVGVAPGDHEIVQKNRQPAGCHHGEHEADNRSRPRELIGVLGEGCGDHLIRCAHDVQEFERFLLDRHSCAADQADGD